MRIDNNSLAAANALQSSNSPHRTQASQTGTSRDGGVTASLSADSQAVSAATAGDDIRQDRVAALKSAIDSGTYTVDTTKVAGAMMETALASRIR